AGPDGEQVGAYRHLPGEDHRAAPDPGAEGPQVHQVQRRAGDQEDQRVGPDQRPDHPEPDVGQAPDADPPRLPPPDQQPFGQDRHGAQDQARRATDDDRAQVDAERAGPGRDPPVGPRAGQRGQPGVAEIAQQLQRPAQDVLPGAGG